MTRTGFPSRFEPLSDGGVVLREWRESDLPPALEQTQDAEVSRHTRIPERQTADELRAFFDSQGPERAAGRALSLVIADGASDEIVGSIGMPTVDWANGRGEIGYWVAAGRRRAGVATAAVRLLTAWALTDLGLARVELHIDPANVASQRVAERAGYEYEGTLRSYELRKGERVDVMLYARLAGSDRAGAG